MRRFEEAIASYDNALEL
ncbi:MAG TPA: hypothetical protein DCE56_08960, partial [Cyanobacteria bacterium UBA8553]|nr:hypothetical protein [Cyanobacteria bacterium UBA8553]